jgi:hypothetical protein
VQAARTVRRVWHHRHVAQARHRPLRRYLAVGAGAVHQAASNILKALWALLWPLAGAIAVGAYLHAPTVLRASQSNHDTAAPVLVPLFLLAMIGIGAGTSVLTGLVWWALLRRRFMAAALLNLALWAAFLGFAQSPSGQAFIRSRQAPVTHQVLPPVPGCDETPPAGGQERQTWDYQCAGRPGVRISEP